MIVAMGEQVIRGLRLRRRDKEQGQLSTRGTCREQRLRRAYETLYGKVPGWHKPIRVPSTSQD